MSNAPTQPGDDDLTVMHPDVTIAIGGRDVKVHEYRFIDGLRIRAASHGLVRDLQATIERAELLTDDVMDVLAKHESVVRGLIAAAADVEPEFIDSLSAADGDKLMTTWWMVNGPFFVRQIIRRMQEAAAVKQTIDGLTSSLASAGPGTASRPNSVSSTPTVS